MFTVTPQEVYQPRKAGPRFFYGSISYKLAFVVCSAFAIVGLIMSSVLRPTKRLQLKI